MSDREPVSIGIVNAFPSDLNALNWKDWTVEMPPHMFIGPRPEGWEEEQKRLRDDALKPIFDYWENSAKERKDNPRNSDSLGWGPNDISGPM